MVTLKNTETGETWEVYPIDAKEIVAMDPKIIVIDDGKQLNSKYSVPQKPKNSSIPIGPDGLVLIRHPEMGDRRVYPVDAREHMEMKTGWLIVGLGGNVVPDVVQSAAETKIEQAVAEAKATAFNDETIEEVRPRRRGRK